MRRAVVQNQTGCRLSGRVRARGIVLPVVLVMLVLMTTAVLFMTKRATIDERLAGNVRAIVTTETVANHILRYCELVLWHFPPGVSNQSPPMMLAPPPTAPAAWTNAANWVPAKTLSFPATELGAGVAEANCLIEDASAELNLVKPTNDGPKDSISSSTIQWRKYRITAQAVGAADALSLAPVARAQSEVRMWIN